MKLKRWGLTAYEYIVFKEEKQERLEKLQNGLMSQQQFEEEEKAAMEDVRKKKKSSIIHQINKENKKAYKERIIERNRKAREQTMREQRAAEVTTNKPNKEAVPFMNDNHKEVEFNEFDNINEDKKVKRVENYDIDKSK